MMFSSVAMPNVTQHYYHQSVIGQERHERHERDERDEKDLGDASYKDPSAHDLNVKTGAALLTADCMGTGILALPGDMKVMGSGFGIGFLVANLFVNFYAGSILCHAATCVEDAGAINGTVDSTVVSYQSTSPHNAEIEHFTHTEEGGQKNSKNLQLTTDFISMTRALFDTQPDYGYSKATATVTTVYYVNIFLVLGNYVLVMSHAVTAMLGDQICLPLAGVIASTLMFGVSQLRTMARLGRTASVISLAALAILVLQCLFPLIWNRPYLVDSIDNSPINDRFLLDTTTTNTSILRKFAAASSIGFAVGSQKLLLNIRHEFKNRTDTPHSLAIALTSFGSVYILVCILAGTGESFIFYSH